MAMLSNLDLIRRVPLFSMLTQAQAETRAGITEGEDVARRDFLLLAEQVAQVAMLTLATNGNIIRTFILGIPVIVGNLYFATALAPLFTRMAADASYTVEGYDGIFTSFLDGGNILRSWLLFLSQGHPAALAVLPVIALMLVITAKVSRKSAG